MAEKGTGTSAHTHKAIAHDAVEAFEGLQVLVGEVELNHSRVPEERAQGGLQTYRHYMGQRTEEKHPVGSTVREAGRPRPGRTHQQLLRDKLHDEFLGPLLSLPGRQHRERRVREVRLSLPHPDKYLQVFSMVHVDLARQRPRQLRVGIHRRRLGFLKGKG